MADYTLPPSQEIAPGYSIFGIPVIPATPGKFNTDLPKLPTLPSIESIPGVKTIEGIGSGIGDVASNVGTAFSILTNPTRVVTVAVGIVLVFVGFNMLSGDKLADAIGGLKKAA